MARRGHTIEGNVFCSDCGSSIEPGARICEHCGENLAEDFNAVMCPYCTTVVEAHLTNCSNCGLKFAPAKGSSEKKKEDDEFLSKLLDWGKNLEKKRVQEDRLETEKATDVFRDVVGALSPSPFQEESLKEIKKSAEEKAEFEKREESIIKVAEPLKRALDLRKRALDELENKFKALQAELDSLSEEDLDSDKKREDIEHQLAEIMAERDSIRTLEQNIENMDSAYRQLLKQHSTEIKEKEENLNTRLAAFKKEMERREKEKEKLKTREDFLEKKERELDARIMSLKEREDSLRQTEEQLKEEIAALEEERKFVTQIIADPSSAATAEPAEKSVVAAGPGGMWLVDPEELASVLKKSKKLREDWFEEQRRMQDSVAGGETVGEAASESRERLAEREKELERRIAELEEKLASTRSEEGELRKQRREVVADIAKLKKVLKILDELLEKLPDDIVEKFARSDDFKEYEEIMQELGL